MDLDTLLAGYAPISPVAGCAPIVAHQSAGVFALWDAWERASGRRQDVPFWAVVWPAARVLARWILDHPEAVRGARVLDFGCGGAVVGIAAACVGASHVVANDIDAVALGVAGRNAAANGVQIELGADDFLAPAPSASPGAFGVAFVADLFYEKDQAARTLRLLAALRGQGARVIVADGGRPFAPARGVVVLAQERVEVDRELEGVGQRTVRILELT